MANDRWERLAPLSGIVFVALIIAGFAVFGTPPKADEPIDKITTFFTVHRSRMLLGWSMVGLAVVFFFWFLGSLRSALARAEGGTGRLSSVAFASGVAKAGLFLAVGAVLGTLVYRVAGEGNAAVIRALFDLQIFLGLVSQVPLAVLMIAASVVMIRTSSAPRWLGWAGLLLGLFQLVAMAAFAESGAMAPGGAIPKVAFILFGLWVLAVSILMLLRQGQVAKPTS